MGQSNINRIANELHVYGIKFPSVIYNSSPAKLISDTIHKKQGVLTDKGALMVETGKFTGRSPKDRFIVKDEITESTVWWGAINQPFKQQKYFALKEKMLDFLSGQELYVRDVMAGADPKYALNVRIINTNPWQNLFCHNMFIAPTAEELLNFNPEFTVIAAPEFKANPKVDGTRAENFSIINFSDKTILIGGSAYTGEIKKGVFSVLNYILPQERDVLPMHCSANKGKSGDTAIFFGLSGTGKTTLSATSERHLIGDDEHGWTDKGVFNFEGGCYAKVIDLSKQKEPQIWDAIQFGALLENTRFIPETSSVDYQNNELTENTRVSYPIKHIENAAKLSEGDAPKNIFFLTCDAYGVLPPISKLNKEQAMYHFILGYTAKVAGTEEGVTEPQTVFSACFGAPFMPLHPSKYAEMLGEKISKENVNVWLINTGWIGGPYGTGSRISLKYTRAMISAALQGDLDKVKCIKHPIFDLDMPITCPGVPNSVLNPRKLWDKKTAYDLNAKKLAEAFRINFQKFKSEIPEDTSL
ncbi:MAG: phosphoenolpyruvate carboxykinase (ATP) [Bacteroidota bacterium]